MDADVIIIGAGAAGLSAAHEIGLSGKSVILLEARDRIGGRIHTIRTDGLPVELGAEFVHGRPPETWTWIERAGLQVRELQGDRWCGEGGSFRGCDFMQDVDSVFEKMDGYQGPDLPFEDYLDRYAGDIEASARTWATEFVQGFDAADSGRISVHSLIETNRASQEVDGERLFCFANGYDSLVQAIAADLKNATIRLSSPVREVEWSKNSVRVRSGDTVVCGAALLVTVPAGVLAREDIRFSPSIDTKLQAARELGVGPVLRVTLVFRDRVWARLHADLERLCMLHTHDPEFPTWWTRQPDAAPVITGWSAGPMAEPMTRLSDADIVDCAIGALSRVLGSLEVKRDVVSGWTYNWETDPYARGAYTWTPAGACGASARLAEPLEETIFFAGEATDSAKIGTVHGAIASGVRGAKQLCAAGLLS